MLTVAAAALAFGGAGRYEPWRLPAVDAAGGADDASSDGCRACSSWWSPAAPEADAAWLAPEPFGTAATTAGGGVLVIVGVVIAAGGCDPGLRPVPILDHSAAR
ncbi:MAG: hypothetical protein R2719_14180 [Micropruina sp.]